MKRTLRVILALAVITSLSSCQVLGAAARTTGAVVGGAVKTTGKVVQKTAGAVGSALP